MAKGRGIYEVISSTEPDLVVKIGEDSDYFKAIFKEHTEKMDRAYQRALTSFDSEKDRAITFSSLIVNDFNKQWITRIGSWKPEMQKGLVLLGQVGTGKSTLCKATINKLAGKDFRCLFVSIAKMFDAIKAAMDKDNWSVEDEIAIYLRPELLILDDLGAEKATEWSIEKLVSLLDERGRTDKITWFTTNLTHDSIKKIYGERFTDRLAEYCQFFFMNGPSFRRTNYTEVI